MNSAQPNTGSGRSRDAATLRWSRKQLSVACRKKKKENGLNNKVVGNRDGHRGQQRAEWYHEPL